MGKLPDPDVFVLKVVKTDGCIWQTYGEYESRLDALEAAERLDPSKYSKAGVMPQIRDFKPFQTHVMQEVRVGK